MSKTSVDTNKTLNALVRREEQYRSIFENTRAGTIISEADMTISLANDEFARMTGYCRSDIEGKMKWTQVVALPEDREKMIRFHRNRRQSRDKAPRNYEFTLTDKENRHKNILARVDVIQGTDKSVGSFIDITPMVRAQQEVRENESRLRGILEAFEGFIYICGQNYRVTYVNKNLAPITGSPGSNLPCHKKIFNSDIPCSWCPLETVYTGQTVKQEIQCRETGRWYYAVSTPIFGPKNYVLRQQTVLIDIHERKQAEVEIKAREAVLHRENKKLRAAIRDRSEFCGIVGKSRAMLEVYELILRAGMTDVNVIVYGESGTGKELVARAIHEMSDRNGNRFVPVHCGAIPPNLMESEFFGVRKGAFTGASQNRAGLLDLAHDGTLFLDELGELDINFQVTLLRVLEGAGYMRVGGRQIREPDIRFVAATNQDLNEQVNKGTMREDFFYRIHILPIYLPPLRERKEDIPLLVSHFLEKHHAQTRQLPAHVMETLQAHDWPGNVRELENSLQRYINLGNLEFLRAGTTQDQAHSSQNRVLGEQSNTPLKEAMNRFEKAYITRILDQHQWNRKTTAKALSIGRKTLYTKMTQLEIQKPGQL